jgi:hypothetical protein
MKDGRGSHGRGESRDGGVTGRGSHGTEKSWDGGVTGRGSRWSHGTVLRFDSCAVAGALRGDGRPRHPRLQFFLDINMPGVRAKAACLMIGVKQGDE